MPSRSNSNNNRGIPVPRDQNHPNRATSSRDQQAQWRSSLDLVWSYSRSQAFYGENIATSPSFVEHHWAGRDPDDEQSIDYQDQDDSDQGDSRLTLYRSSTETETDIESISNDDGFDSAEMEWEGENLPFNAVARTNRHRARTRGNRLDPSQDQAYHKGNRSTSPNRLPTDSPPTSRLSASNLDHHRNVNRNSIHSNSSTLEVPPLRDPYATESTRLTRDTKGTTPSTRRCSSGYGAVSHPCESLLSYKPRSIVAPSYVHGTSTFLQSWFNTVNALVGVGILALPLAFSYAGWFGGISLFLACGILTNYTGKVLAKIMLKEPSLRTYADIGNYAFGPQARLLVSLFFCLELWAVAVALLILFGDSMSAIFPSIPSAVFKLVGFCFVLPTVFLPLKFLSPVSVIGIISTATLVTVVVSDGLIKQQSPGSLWHPAHTTLGPQWSKLPLSFGLIMSGFSSHPVIPSLYKDMKDPSQFSRMLNLAYVAATFIYMAMGMAGYAMFGTSVSDEISRDLAKTEGFPVLLNSVAIWLIVINPLAKFALATRPVQTTLEILLGLDTQPGEKARRSSANANTNTTIAATTTASASCCKRVDLGADSTLPQGRPVSPSAAPAGIASSSSIDPSTPIRCRNPDTISESIPSTELNNKSLNVDQTGSGISLLHRNIVRFSFESFTPQTRFIYQVLFRILLTVLITLTAILFPGFEKVMAFLGAFLAFATCVFGPLLANLKLFGNQMSSIRIMMDLFILSVSAILAILGTIWVCCIPSS